MAEKLKPGIFAFLKAAESGDEEAVKKFLDEGGDVHASDDGHNTALHLVILIIAEHLNGAFDLSYPGVLPWS